MIKNIIFDVGNILIQGRQEATLEFYPELKDEEKDLLKEVFFLNPDWHKMDLGEDDLASFYEKHKDLIKDLKLKEKAKEIVLNCGQKRHINNEVIDLMQTLKNKAYKIYILSDNMIDNARFIKSIKRINDNVDGYCFSCFFHKTKDDGTLYEVLFKEFSLNPKECYFIDDIEENIKKGLNFGMDGFNLNWENKKFNDLIADLKVKKILS